MHLQTTMYRAGSALARALPDPWARRASRAGGYTASRLAGGRRAIVERNLERVIGRSLGPGERRRLVDATFESYARYYVQSFRLPKMGRAEIDAGFSYRGVEHIDDSLGRGIGPILALPHLGGWEWAAFWLALIPRLRVTAVVEPLEPPDLFEWFLSYRRSLGMEIVPLGSGAAAASARAINEGRVLCLLADRDLTGEGVPVEFFGEVTTLPAGPALLALRSGAPIIPTACYFHGDGIRADCRPPLDTERRGRLREDVQRVTQDLAHVFEDMIAKAPEQWHLMQPNWPSDYDALGLARPPHLVDLGSA